MNGKGLLVTLATLCIFSFLFIIVNSQKQTKPVTKNGVNLRQIQNGGNKRNNIRIGNRKVTGVNNNNNNNKVKGNKNKGKRKNKGKSNNKNKGKNNNNSNGNTIIKDNGFLSLQNENLVYKSKKIFISGVNLLYVNLGKYFGNGNYAKVKTQYESWLKEVSDAGGNAIRVIIHGDGNTTPMLDTQGYATGQETGSLIQDLSLFLDTAQSYNLFAFLTLWNGALNFTIDKVDIFKNDLKLDRYIEKILKPVVSGLSTKKALGAWEVITFAQGSVRNDIVDSNPCFDTQNLFHQLATFTTNNQTMKDMQKFINKQLDAIKTADPKALRSIISKEEEASDFCDWCYNYWSDKCLISAGGKSNGVLDFYDFDAVAFVGYDYYWSPLKKKPSDYKLGKPIVIATSSGNCSDSKSGVTNFNNAFLSGYAGIFAWRYNPGLFGQLCSDTPAQCDASMSAIRNNNIIKISFQ